MMKVAIFVVRIMTKAHCRPNVSTHRSHRRVTFAPSFLSSYPCSCRSYSSAYSKLFGDWHHGNMSAQFTFARW